MAEDFDVEAMLEAPYRKNGAERKGRRLKDYSPEHAKDEHSSSKHRVEKHSDRHKHSERSKDGSKRSGRSRSRDRRKSRERSKSRRRSREKDRSDREFKSGRGDKDKERDRVDRGDRDKERDRGRNDRERNDRDRSDRDRNDKDRDRDRDREGRDKEGRDKEKEKERERRRQRSRSREARRATGTAGAALLALNLLAPLEELAPEERDARTVFCMQLSQNIRSRELEEFFSAVGKVRDVRLITCNKTRRFKGIAYIEFKDTESVPLALGLTGQKLLGIPIIVQHTQAEKNRTGNSLPNLAPKNNTGPTRLYVGSLHFNITEDMLRGIFEPFGKIDNIQLITDLETGKSQGYGFLTFHHAADAKKALEQLNGFELAGRPMKVGNVTERMESAPNDHHPLDTDEMDRAGIDLGATGRLQLMFKLAEGTGFQVPPAAANMLKMTAGLAPSAQQVCPPIATQCFMLNNMFDPSTETNPSWDVEIRDDVIEECNKHGGVLHVYVDKGSPQGNVYVKCPDVTVAVASVNSLHGRWFAGRVITAAYVPLVNYHSLFPDAMSSFSLLSLSGMRRNA